MVRFSIHPIDVNEPCHLRARYIALGVVVGMCGGLITLKAMG
jgi:hypothetical protein